MNPVEKTVLINEYKKNIEWYSKDNEKKPNKAIGVNLTTELQEAMIQVAQVLTNTKFMKDAFKTLNEAMLKKYEEKMNAVAPTTPLKARMEQLRKEMAKAKRDEDDNSRHLLSMVLHDFEKEHGFKTFQAVNGHPRIIQMTGLLSGKDFVSTLGAGHMAKDYVTIEHGVYSHRIQWYCLGQSNEFNIPNLKDLFIKFQEGLAWLLTFDRREEHPRNATGNGAITLDDFRTPEKMHAYFQMADAEAVCPLVSEYIKGKHKAIKDHSWVNVRMAVAARKLYPEKKAELDGWKSLPKAQLQPKLKSVLGLEKYKELETFMKGDVDGHNVLYPQGDGAYKTTPQA
jgi:type VI secretion system protein VasG